jgi:hypothetical protein
MFAGEALTGALLDEPGCNAVREFRSLEWVVLDGVTDVCLDFEELIVPGSR